MIPTRSRLRRTARWAGLSLAAGLGSCSKQPDPVQETPYWEIAQRDAMLERGREVWRADCRRCHAHGLEGAPRIGDAEAWQPRVARGLDALVESALAGVQGKAGGEMPPRGGNESLSDGDVRAAVAFMLAAVADK